MKGGDFVNTSQEIAERIKLYARDKGVKLGVMLSDIGVSESTLRNMKNKGCMPSIETLIKIALYLECSLDDLCGTEDIKNNAGSNVRTDVIKMINGLSDRKLERLHDFLTGLNFPSE